MTYRIYPNSTPEFRWIELKSGSFMLQVRYINQQVGYTGKWLTVPSITEDEANKELQISTMPVQTAKEEEKT
jgi:hypothetical protein